MTSRLILCLVLAGIATACSDAKLVGTYYHSPVNGVPFDPRAEPYYGNGSSSTREYMALCVYDDDTYGYLTHYWNGHEPDHDEISYDELTRPTPDSVVFPAWSKAGHVTDNQMVLANGKDVFTKATWITCPATH